MNYLFILDLSGTLMEGAHVCCRNEIDKTHPFFNEYDSRINYVGRKLNNMLNNNHNRIIILTSEDHCTIEELEVVIKDINSTILDKNIERIEYFVSIELAVNIDKPIHCIMENGNKIIKVQNKSLAYDKVLKMYKNYYPITIDDRPSFECFAKVLEKNGECIFIQNELNTFAVYTYEFRQLLEKRHHVRDNIDTLIPHYYRCADIFSFSYENVDEMPEYLKFSIEETYKMLHNGTLNVEDFYNWRNLTDIKKGFIDIGYSLEDIESLINHHCIEVFPSFEMAYQKRLVPKIKK